MKQLIHALIWALQSQWLKARRMPGLVPAIAVIGDSTFTHSGITGLLDAVKDKSPITVFILDNATTAMTGGQPSAATGKIEDICQGVGVEPEHVNSLNPLRSTLKRTMKSLQRNCL